MIVCSCNVIREQELRQAARLGYENIRDVYAHLGCEPNCCQCLPFAEMILQEETRIAA